ncbi:hypothetical protein BGZ72_007239 [Mortierella alpina]|nr:hypothetical protein BGZ72_007239 [Mortierella alpina]
MASAATEQDDRVDQQLGRDMGLAADEHDTTLEPESAPFNKCFVLSAIVVFLAIGCSSVPNLLSARNPQEGIRTTSITTDHTHYPSGALGYSKTPAEHLSDGVGPAILSAPGAGTQEHKRTSNLWNQIADRALGNEHEDVEMKPQGSGRPSSFRNSQAQGSTSSSTSSALHVSTPAAGSHQEQLLRKSPPPILQETNMWPLIQKLVWLVLRASLWSMRTSFRLTRLVVSKPVNAFIAVAEPPYTIVRDMCRAFLPVYSFFAVAAIVGIVVGGSATWIAQQLIAALGADKERATLSRMNMGIMSDGPTHATTAGHGRPLFAYEVDTFVASDEEFLNQNSSRRGPAQLDTKTTALMPEAPPHNKRGPTMVEVEEDYGDDDDDDDDDDEDDDDDARDGDWQGR